MMWQGLAYIKEMCVGRNFKGDNRTSKGLGAE